MTKIHVDDLISWHVIDCSKLVTNWFVVKLYPKKISYKSSYIVFILEREEKKHEGEER